MPTLTATDFATEGYVLVIADWSDTPSVTYAGVTRRNTVTGETVALRPHGAYDADGNLLLNCGIGIWWDTEPPLNVPLEYCTTAADVATVLSSNPSFEVGTAPWQTSGGALTQSALNVKTGAFSGRLVSNGTVAAATGIYIDTDTYTLLAGYPVTISGWILAVTGWNGARITLEGLGADGFIVGIATDIEILDDGEYRYLSTTFTPTVDIQVIELRVTLLGLPPNTTAFHFDDVQVAQMQPVAATACDTVTVTSESIFLKSPLHPCSDVTIDLCNPAYGECAEDTGRVSYAGHSDDEYDANTAVPYPVNRRRPIPVNRIRRDARSVLTVITHDCAAKDAVLSINEPGDPLLWQDGTGLYCIEDRYMSVATVAVRRIGVDQRDEFRLITMPYVVVDRPEGPADGPCGTRFQDLCDIYTSWGALEISDLDWIDLPTGGASHDSPTNPLPPAARTWGEVETEFATWSAVEAGGTRDWGELRDGL